MSPVKLDQLGRAAGMGPESAPTQNSKSVQLAKNGRFSAAEKQILFSIIREDSRIMHEFLHQATGRTYGGKRGWMHEIGARFNERSSTKRKLDAIRHHLLLRKPGRHTWSGEEVRCELECDPEEIVHLLKHSRGCENRYICTKCLLMDRYRVQYCLCKCPLPTCVSCDSTLPDVALPFDIPAAIQHFEGRAARQGQPKKRHAPPEPAAAPAAPLFNPAAGALTAYPYHYGAVQQPPLPLSLAGLPIPPQGFPLPSPHSAAAAGALASPDHAKHLMDRIIEAIVLLESVGIKRIEPEHLPHDLARAVAYRRGTEAGVLLPQRQEMPETSVLGSRFDMQGAHQRALAQLYSLDPRLSRPGMGLSRAEIEHNLSKRRRK